jgi:protein gp37
VHFISYEPAIGPLDQVDLDRHRVGDLRRRVGPGYRPFDQQWARDMRDRCVARGIAFS